ncbi:hypothetical protein [Mycolicibacterium fortuitum]|uniref:hypothetical protein n=1 Tax=Mycolicibacterium fortuitum TaxID=1766 RepID=UPI0026275B00|nr:hypothetical protein [Mycolicibacterium fortuitum]
MGSNLRRSNIGWEAVEAAVAKTQKLDKADRAAIVKAHKSRLKRRDELDSQAAAIKRATAKYAILDRGERPEIRIRKSFARLDTPRPRQEDDSWPTGVREKLLADVDSRPPLTKLIHRPSNALQMYLSLIYVAQLEFEPGTRWRNERDNNGRDGWGELCGLLAPATLTKELNLRVTRALAKLSDHDLVRVGEWNSRNRFDGFTLYREDERQTYLAPSASESRSLPAAFFTAGWHLVLTNDEMATLLAVVEQTGRRRSRKDAAQVGVALPLSERWRFYGLAPEAFAARHELEEFGLIESVDPMDRTHGKLSEKQRQGGLRAPRITLKLDGFDFSSPAIEVVKAKLVDPVPPRWASRARQLQLLDDAGRWREPRKP